MPKLEQEILKRGLLTEQTLQKAVRQAQAERRQLQELLLKDGYITEAELLAVMSECYSLPVFDPAVTAVQPAAIRAVSPKLVSHYYILPVALKGRTLTVAVADPLNMQPVEDLEAHHGWRVERMLATARDIEEGLKVHYGVGADTVARMLDEAPRPAAVEIDEVTQDVGAAADDASVIHFVNQLLHEAIRARSSDIHFEMQNSGPVIRRRIDGILYDIPIPPGTRTLYPALVSRIKLMAGLNIVERRMPQDGRARVRLGRSEYDLRISVVPALHGEDVVIRILPVAMLFDLAQLGFSSGDQSLLTTHLEQTHGILFVTGPTGSGKSTTLYACLKTLNTRERKIITIEDPVEYELAGITQTQIAPGLGLTFAHALRSMLRHDPDVMMVGEVRDAETAEIAVQTAMTGHLVLSTLHTNDAASGAVRLMDMGIDPYLITSTVRLFMAQRLVRVLCKECRRPDTAAEVAGAYCAEGCRACGQSGYAGRVAISEFLPLVAPLQRLILDRAGAPDIRAEGDRQGWRTLADDGWSKVAAGITSAAEVMRVVNL